MSKLLYSNLTRFEMLDALDAETKRRLFPLVTVYENQLVKVQVMRLDVTVRSFLLLAFVGLVASIFSAPALARLWLGRGGTTSIETIVITGVVAIGILYFILWFPRLINIILPFRGLFLIGRKLLLLMVPCGMAVVFFGLALLLSLIPSTMRATLSYALVSGMLLAAEFILALFAAFMLTALLDEGIRRGRNARYPVAVVVDNLMFLLQHAQYVLSAEHFVEHLAQEYKTIEELVSGARRIELLKDYQVQLEERQQQMFYVEEAATCLEHYLPRKLRSGDPITDVWFNETMQQAATALREKKRWLLTPKQDTTFHLLETLTTTLICVLEGNWDNLERMKPEDLVHDLSRIRLWRARLLTGAKALVIALFPLIIFLIIQLTPLAFTGSVREYVTIGVFIWMALSFIAALDPTFNLKISAVKDLMGFFPFTKQNPR